MYVPAPHCTAANTSSHACEQAREQTNGKVGRVECGDADGVHDHGASTWCDRQTGAGQIRHAHRMDLERAEHGRALHDRAGELRRDDITQRRSRDVLPWPPHHNLCPNECRVYSAMRTVPVASNVSVAAPRRPVDVYVLGPLSMAVSF